MLSFLSLSLIVLGVYSSMIPRLHRCRWRESAGTWTGLVWGGPTKAAVSMMRVKVFVPAPASPQCRGRPYIIVHDVSIRFALKRDSRQPRPPRRPILYIRTLSERGCEAQTRTDPLIIVEPRIWYHGLPASRDCSAYKKMPSRTWGLTPSSTGK